MVMISLANSRAALVAGSIAAGAAFLGAGALVTSPALAGQKAIKVAATVDTDTDCSKWQPGELMADTECEVLRGKALRQEGKALATEGKILDERLAAKQAELAERETLKACLVKIKAALDTGVVKRTELGTVTKKNACELATKLNLS